MEKTPLRASVGWDLGTFVATYTQGDFSFGVDLAHPARGLRNPVFRGRQLPDVHVFRLTPSPPPPSTGETVIDAYIRGEDLVVTYAQTASRTVRPQVYWRGIAPAPQVSGVELIVSMQTSLLDSSPVLSIETHWPAAETLIRQHDGGWKTCGPGETTVSAEPPAVFLFRPADAAFSYAELIFPADFRGAVVSPGSLRYQLFPEFLEKGVIRRARLQGVWLPREHDGALATKCYERLIESALPLTT